MHIYRLHRVQLFLLALISINVFSQDYNQLVKQKETLIKEANYLNLSLKEIQNNQKNTIEELKIINKKIIIQESILSAIESEIFFLDQEKQKLKKQLLSLDTNLKSLQSQYSLLVKQTHISLKNYSPVLFFLSSKTFNQFTRRVEYFRQIEADRKQTYNSIKNITVDIIEKEDALLQKKIIQIDLSNDVKREKKELKKIKGSQTKAIEILKNKEDSLLKEIIVKNQEKDKITAEIVRILNKEKETKNNLTPELALLSENFKSNKGRLPWPTITGTVITKFGEIPHPVLSGVTIMNNGIELATTNEQVRSVFAGEVSKIIILPNGLKVVIVRHGGYFTVYSNLYEVVVKKGQKIKAKENIGVLYNQQEKTRNILGFQIWREREKLNPTQWLTSY